MKKLLNNKYIVLFILSSLGTGCRKDSPIPEPQMNICDTTTVVNCDTCSTCEDFPELTGSGFGHQYFITGTQYYKPCFNPNNENEFIYIRKPTPNTTELVKYDLVTKSESILCNTEYIISQPQWGKLGVITFSTLNWKVWAINEDGSNLVQLTFGENDQYPYFNFNGDKIYYSRIYNYSNSELDQNPSLYNNNKIMIIDINGNVIDSVTAINVIPNNYYQIWSVASFQQNNIYFMGGTDSYVGIYSLNIASNNIIPLHTWNYESGYYHPLDLDFTNNKIYYPFWHNNLNVFDISTNTNNLFLEGCDTKYYDKISVSPNNNEMLVEKVINTVTDYYGGTINIDEKHEIWLINLNDKTETKILGQ